MTSNDEDTEVVTSVAVTSDDVTSATPGHVANTTTSGHVTRVVTTSAHVTTTATTSTHVTARVAPVVATSAHVTPVATTSAHVTTHTATSAAKTSVKASTSADLLSSSSAAEMTPKLSDPPATNGTVQPITPPAAKVTSELSDPPDSDGTAQLSSPSDGKVTSELSEPPVAKVTSELSEPPVAKVTSELSEPPVAKVTSELSEPPVAKVTSEPPVAKVKPEPSVAKVTSEPSVAKVTPVPEPSVAKVTSEPSVAKVTPVPEPSVAKVTSEPPVAKVTPEPSVAKVKTEPSNPPVAKVTSELSSSGGTAQLSSPPAANGTHQLYQVVPVVQNGVQCRLLMPLNMVPSMPKVVTAGGKVVQQPTVRSPVASSSSQLPTGNSKFLLQQVKVAQQPGSTASSVVHVLSPAGTTAAAGGARPGKDGKVGSVAPGTVISSSVGQSTTGAIGKVIAVTPTIAPGGKVVLPPAAPVATPVKPGSTVIQVPGSSVASPSVYNIIKVTPPPPGGTLTIGPNTRLVVVSAPSTGVTQSLGPRTSAALGSVAVVTPTVKSTTSAKPTIVKTHTTLPVGKPMVATSAGQHKIVIVPQTTVPAQTTNMIIPHTSTVSAQATARVVVPTSSTSTVPAAPKQVSMLQQNENVVLINGQPYKLVPCPTTTHIPVDALKSTAAAATVSSAAVQTAATVKVPISSSGSKVASPAKVTVTSAVVQTVAPATVTFSSVVAPATHTQVTASNSTALTQTQVTASTSTAGGVTSASEGNLRTDERSGSETETASEASPVESKDPESSEAGEGPVLKIDSVYSLKGASKAPGTPPSRPSLDTQTIAQNSSAANTLKNIANIHSAVVNTPKKYIVVYPNKPAVPPSPPRASTQTPVTQTATKRLEPAETKPATPPASPVKRPKPAEKQPSPKSVTTPKSVTEMYHSYAKGKAETSEPPAPQVKRSVTALMVRTTPLGKSTVAMGSDPSGPPSLPPSKIFRLEPPRPNETIQDERVRRLKEILREREAAVEELRKRKKT